MGSFLFKGVEGVLSPYYFWERRVQRWITRIQKDMQTQHLIRQSAISVAGLGETRYASSGPFGGYRSSTFTLTQEQIDNLTYVFVYGANKEDTEKNQTFKYIRIYDPTETETTDIILDAPITPGESINKINDNLLDIKLHRGINMLTVQTEVSPSAVNWQYYKY